MIFNLCIKKQFTSFISQQSQMDLSSENLDKYDQPDDEQDDRYVHLLFKPEHYDLLYPLTTEKRLLHFNVDQSQSLQNSFISITITITDSNSL